MGGAPPPPPDSAPQGPQNGNFWPPARGVKKGHGGGPRISVHGGVGGLPTHYPRHDWDPARGQDAGQGVSTPWPVAVQPWRSRKGQLQRGLGCDSRQGITAQPPTNCPSGDPTALSGDSWEQSLVVSGHLATRHGSAYAMASTLARVGMVKTRTQRSEQAFNRVNVPSLDWPFRDGRESVPYLGTGPMPVTVRSQLGPIRDPILDPISDPILGPLLGPPPDPPKRGSRGGPPGGPPGGPGGPPGAPRPGGPRARPGGRNFAPGRTGPKMALSGPNSQIQ